MGWGGGRVVLQTKILAWVYCLSAVVCYVLCCVVAGSVRCGVVLQFEDFLGLGKAELLLLKIL